MGCPACYTEFCEELTPLLRRIHGSVIHRGKGQRRERGDTEMRRRGDAGIRGHGDSPRRRVAASFLAPRADKAAPVWMQGVGPDCDVVISTRVRLARNILGHTFCSIAAKSELQQIAASVEDAIADIRLQGAVPPAFRFSDASIIELKHLSAIDREFLVERHLISRDLAERSGAGKVILGEKEVVSIMLNEEDHIRLQVINSGLQIRQSWEMINTIDDELGGKINYAFSPDWGYLTACPTNVGTGLRVSVMLHIPALSATEWLRAKNIEQRAGEEKSPTPYALCSMLPAISDMGYAVRGMYGEGSQATEAFYQISNEATLGQSEEEIVDRIQSVARQIVDREREERLRLCLLIEKNGIEKHLLEDKIFRSYGTLTNARLISSREALDLLSWVSLGVSLGMIGCRVADYEEKEGNRRKEEGSQRERGSEGTRERGSGYSPPRPRAPSPSSSDIARLLVLTRPAHLQKYEGRKLDAAARDISRAAVIRAVLTT